MTYPLFFYVSFCAVFMATSAIGLQESADLKNDLYFLNWYDYHPSTKKAIKIMLEKMKRPIVLKAGGLAIVNWELFANVSMTYEFANVRKNLKKLSSYFVWKILDLIRKC
ncbi:unnamed protein product [Nesidiocoris tenuis]|uniref:Uncharacterized protein n=1 Tax=Nesidiocoris tenuis TaxID=355587 RepID=A0A6H5HHD3_9HEMI|nr:unnamed protein product [Nesidiocoris tenuis]